ncbi:MAG TPA: nitronate monooxygenase [Acidimicrobiales bacterium]|nr:nitronate monooxygenase [Acidimicrobiales bacterium]
MDTRFTQLVGCAVPIQQAPMGAVSTPGLALAVADAGGVGSIAAIGMPAARLEVMLSDMAGSTNGVLAANFLTNEIDRDAVAVAARLVRLVDFFWTDPDQSLVEIAHRAGALASWQVGSLAEAKAAVDAGCDVIVVQGIEAGGHVRGTSSLLPLLAAVLDEVDIPVLASGGIGDGRSLAAVLAAGAAGARLGTRFVATHESGAHLAYKRAVVEARFAATEITDAFAVCPLCATSPRARVLRSCVDAVRSLDLDVIGEGSIGGQTVSLPRGSGLPPGEGFTGRIDAMAMYAGESVHAVESIAPAATVLADLCQQAERLLAEWR